MLPTLTRLEYWCEHHVFLTLKKYIISPLARVVVTAGILLTFVKSEFIMIGLQDCERSNVHRVHGHDEQAGEHRLGAVL